jgi:acyl-CoA dehydrogenase
MNQNPELTGLIDEFFRETFGPDVITAVERNGPSAALWNATEALGLPLIGIAEEDGGSGGTLGDLLDVLQGAGRWAVPLPLAETSLAAWLLASCGARVPTGPMTVIPDASGLHLGGDRLTGEARAIPWLRGAARVVAVVDGCVVAVDPAALDVTPGADLAGMPCDLVTASGAPTETYAADVTADSVLLRGALLRSAQIAGAVTAAYEITRTYIKQRVQFGKPIARFQSVQMHLVELAQAATLTTLCVERAGRAAATGTASLEIVATKSVANRHAGLAVRAAHQAHGAIGMTREYRLQHLTRRLHTWRGDFGDETSLNLRLGAAMADLGGIIAAATSVASTVGV